MRNNNRKEQIKGKSTGKSKRSSRRRTTETKALEDKDVLTKDKVKNSSNDPAWYAADPVLLRDAASFPFSYVTGASDTHDLSLYPAATWASGPYNGVAGVASFHIYPCVGTVLGATDPINVAAQSVYSFVRHANSGHSNYDPCDLMMYILAMANMYSFLVWCQRCYGYALTYDQRNRYIPKELLRTNDVDADDLIANLANFRFWINTLIAKMASFAVPATMSVFSRMSFLYSDYYIEGTSIKDQLYQFVPDGFYKFGIDANQKGELAWTPFDYTNLMSVNDIMTYGDTLFNAIWSQEDFGIMSGDILKAYGDRIIKLSSIPEYYSIAPKFDPMVLTQMKNADIVRVAKGRISQDASNGIILQTVLPSAFTTSEGYINGTAFSSSIAQKFNNAMTAANKDYNILTVDTDDPTPDVVIEATRLKVAYDPVKNWFHVGTEVVTSVEISSEPGTSISVGQIIAGYDEVATVACHRLYTKLVSAGKMFHYLPKLIIVWMDTNVTLTQDVLFDIDNFTVLTYQDILKLHEAAVINMFAVPSIGKVQ